MLARMTTWKGGTGSHSQMVPTQRDPAQKFPSPKTHSLNTYCVQGSRRPGPITTPPPPLQEVQSGVRLPVFSPSRPGPSTPRPATGAAYRAVGGAGAHFVPSGVPAHLEDAASASVAVHQTPALQSKAQQSSLRTHRARNAGMCYKEPLLGMSPRDVIPLCRHGQLLSCQTHRKAMWLSGGCR